MKRVALISAAALLQCTPPSESRALADLAVGHSQHGDSSVQVIDGLAAVHRHDAAELTLWCSAPAFDIALSGGGERVVTLSNAMPDGELTLIDAASGATIEPLASERPTVKRYRVMLADSATLHFGPPDEGDRSAWRMGVLSDIQGGIDEVQDVFAGINAAHAADPGLRFVLGAGDLSSSGTAEELWRFQAEMETLALPYYSTLGNHDAPPDTPWHAIFGRGSYHFVYRGVHFSLVDSASATVEPMVYDWLGAWLAAGRDATHVFAMHIPALDPVGVRNGAFGSRGEAGKLLSLLHQHQVDVTIYGHIHSFYQFDNAGIPAFISGGGGALPEQLDLIGRHFMIVELGADAGLIGTQLVQID